MTPKTIYCSGSTKVDIDEYQDIGNGSWKKNRGRSCHLLRFYNVEDFIDYKHYVLFVIKDRYTVNSELKAYTVSGEIIV